MYSKNPDISVTEPVSPAIERVKNVLFRPFNFDKWLAIGFCAWLANMVGSGMNFNYHPPTSRQHFGNNFHTNSPEQFFGNIRQEMAVNLYWIIPLAIFGLLIGIALGLLFLWLSSKGRFMFLHCIVKNKAEVKKPWHKYNSEVNSLFKFKIVMMLIGFAATLLILAPVIIIFATSSHNMGALLLLPFIFCFPLFIAVVICMGLINVFTKDFVVPIMFMHRIKCTEAWRHFLTILKVHKSHFFIYILFRILIGIVIGTITTICSLILVFCTCCAYCCISIIPFLGGIITTVVFLPLPSFVRSYSLYYLRQFGPDYDIFAGSGPDDPTGSDEPTQYGTYSAQYETGLTQPDTNQQDNPQTTDTEHGEQGP